MKYVKKRIPIEAIQWTGNNSTEIIEFMGDSHPVFGANNEIIVKTVNGEAHAPVGSFIIHGVDGDFYPCRADIFEESYERAEDPYLYHLKCDYCENMFDAHPQLFYDSIHDFYCYYAICPNCHKRVEWRISDVPN